MKHELFKSMIAAALACAGLVPGAALADPATDADVTLGASFVTIQSHLAYPCAVEFDGHMVATVPAGGVASDIPTGLDPQQPFNIRVTCGPFRYAFRTELPFESMTLTVDPVTQLSLVASTPIP